MKQNAITAPRKIDCAERVQSLEIGTSSNTKSIIKLLPLLALYLILIAMSRRSEFWGDEGGYARFAENLTHGFYSPPDEIDLWWGPGYPIVLAPLVLLKLPWLVAKLLNAFFLFAAVVYFYKTLRLYLSSKYLLPIAYLFGFYPPFLRLLSYMMTETLVIFLISALTYHFCKVSQSKTTRWTDLILPGLCLGYLTLTKVFFGYVVPVFFVMSALAFLLLKRKDVVKRAMATCFIAWVVCFPYLAYTYSLTGKLFYWGTSGGASLYWISTPFDGELGDCGPVFSNRARWAGYVQELKGEKPPAGGAPKMAENHLPFFDKVAKLPTVVDQDAAFKKAALENIRSHPFKYLKNWLANVGRMLFDYPYSYREQTLRTYFYALPNMFIFVLVIVSVYPLWRYRSAVPTEIYLLLAFCIIAIGGTSLLAAQTRQFYVLTPILDLGIVIALGKSKITPSVARV